jgi:hypothetical protein
MKYHIRPTTRFRQITHFDSEQCYMVTQISVVQGPGEVRDTLDGLTPIPNKTTPIRPPMEISNWRCKAVLFSMGLLPQVEELLDQLPEPQRTIVNLAWNSDAKVARNSPLVQTLAGALNLTSTQVDTLFKTAAQLTL